MKSRIIAGVLLIMVLLVGVSSIADANKWRGCRGGWYIPHPVVRIFPPVPIIVPPVVIGGGYYGGGYYGRPYYRPRYYAHGYGGYGHYDRGYYRGRR